MFQEDTFEMISAESVNYNTIRYPLTLVQRFYVTASEWAKKMLEIDFEQKTDVYDGLLVVPLITIVIFANSGYVLIPKYDAYELDPLDLFIQEMVTILNLTIISIFVHNFGYICIMGESDVCTGINLLVLFLNNFVVFFTYLYISRIFKVQCLFPRNVNHLVAMILQRITMYTFLWYQHPNSQRSDRNFQTRYKWYILYQILVALTIQGYIQIAKLFDLIMNLFPFLLAFLLLGMKHLTMKILNKVVEKARGDNELSARFAIGCGIGCNHAFYLMIIIGSKARLETTIIYTLIDTILTLTLFIRSLYAVNDQENQDSLNYKNAIQALTLKEILEIIVPTCFCPIYIMASFGPNKDALSVGKNITLDEIVRTLRNIGFLTLFDVFRIGSFSLYLKTKYQISLFENYCKLMNVYWKFISAMIAIFIYLVSF